MEYTLKIRVVEGRQVRDPETDLNLPSTPVVVQDTPYWRRRLVKGDVVLDDATPVSESDRKGK